VGAGPPEVEGVAIARDWGSREPCTERVGLTAEASMGAAG
jgi:hypothetical protein